MDLTSLKTSLKQNYLPNVNAYLRIQLESYKHYLVQVSSNVDIDEIKLHNILKGWINVFDTIISELKHRLDPSSSSFDREFGNKLTRITFSTIAQLITQTLRYAQHLDHYDIKAFTTSLSNYNITVRELLNGSLQLENEPISTNQSLITTTNVKDISIKYSNEQENLEIYNQYLFNNIDCPILNWNDFMIYSCRQFLNNLERRNITLAKTIASRLALPYEQLIKYVLMHTMSFDIQKTLCDQFGCDISMESQIYIISEDCERKAWIQFLISKLYNLKVRFSIKLQASFNSLQQVDDQCWQLMMINKETNLIQNLTTEQLHLQAELASITNDVKHLLVVSDELLQRSDNFTLEQKIIDLFSNLPEVSRQQLLHKLFEKTGYTANHNKINQILNLKYHSFKDRQQIDSLEFDFNFKNQSLFFDEFFKYLCDHNLHEIIYWLLRLKPNYALKFFQMQTLDPLLKRWHQSLLEYDQNPEDSSKAFAMIIESIIYLQSLFPSKLSIKNIDDLVSTNKQIEAFVCWFLVDNLHQQTDLNLDKFIQYNCSNYPIMARSFRNFDTEQSYSERCNRLPNLYELLQHSFMFDVGRLFTWQQNNILVSKSESNRKMPHFSRTELNTLYGLRAELSYLYFLTRGRPQEAFVKFNESIKNDLPEIKQKRTDNAIRKTTALALRNSHNGCIALACIQLLRLLKADIGNLLLHLKVGHLIATHAIEYLGLTVAHQHLELGKLLNQLHECKDRSVATRTFELIKIALERQHRIKTNSFSFPEYAYNQDNFPEIHNINENRLLIKQLFEQKLLVEFARVHCLPPPLEFVRRCIRVNHWLLVTVYAQLYDLPPNILINLLEQNQNSENGCVLDHLITAFSPKRVFALSEKSKSPSELIEDKMHRLRLSLYDKVGVPKSCSESSMTATYLSNKSSSSSSPNSLDRNTFVKKNTHLDHSENVDYQTENNDISLEMNSSPNDLESIFLDTCSMASNTSTIDMSFEYWKNLATRTVKSVENSSRSGANSPNDYENNSIMKLMQNKNLPIKRVRSLFDILLFCERSQIEEIQQSLLNSTILLRNPIGALFACSVTRISRQSYISPSMLFDCFCCWYCATVRLHLTHLDNNIKYFRIKWSTDDCLSLLNDSLGSIKSLQAFQTGLQIFKVSDKNPLHYLIDYLIDFRLFKNYYNSLPKLSTFVQKFNEFNLNSTKQVPPTKKSYFNDFDESIQNKFFDLPFWVQEASLLLVDCSLKSIDQLHELYVYLKHLETCGIGQNILVCGRLKFISQFKQLINLLIDFELPGLIMDIIRSNTESNDFQLALNKLTSDLHSKGEFDMACNVAKLFNLNLEKLLFNEFTIKAEQHENEIDFWLEFLNTLFNSQLSNKLLIDFLNQFKQKCVSTITNSLITSHLIYQQLNFELDAKQAAMNLKDLLQLIINFSQDIEFHDIDLKNHQNEKFYALYWKNLNEILEKIGLLIEKDDGLFDLINNGVENMDANKNDVQYLNQVIDTLLNRGCLRLCHLFFKITQLELPEKIVCLIDCQNLINTFVNNETIKTIQNQKEVLLKLHKISENLGNCDEILFIYRISIMLQVTWLEIRYEFSSLTLLKKLLEIYVQMPEIIHEIRQLIIFNKYSDDQLVEIICQDLERILQNDHQSINQERIEPTMRRTSLTNGNQNTTDKNKNIQKSFWIKCKSMERFVLFVKLLKNPCILGNELLRLAKSNGKSLIESVEFCVRAHECYSLVNDIQGISNTLNFAQELVLERLHPYRAYDLMLRLLIGIERYSEMRYIFELLNKEMQLKLLFDQKQHITSSSLKMALIDTFKNDNEILNQIATNFHMHREIGQILEMQALRSFTIGSHLLNILYEINANDETKSTTNQSTIDGNASNLNSEINTISGINSTSISASTFDIYLPSLPFRRNGQKSNKNTSRQESTDLNLERERLQKALDLLLDAHDHYQQSECFRRSQRCERLCELIAIRLLYIQDNCTSSMAKVNILTMTSLQADQWIQNHAQFQDSWIVAQVYVPTFDWSTALLNRVLIGGDWQYYRDFCTRCKLDFNICLKLSQKVKEIKNQKNLTPDRIKLICNNWLKLINLVTDVRLAYRLAIEHNHVSVSSSLLETNSLSGAYLSDLRRLKKL